ncbi:uncharacterized protein LW93_4619 [Fusarium fujikuroi]|nr:uncharacterized protein LW93_4619 [Fusarium fujikuroi]
MKLNSLLLLLSLFSWALGQRCDNPNGEWADYKYKPCGSGNTTFSTCCLPGDRCLPNGLCEWTGHFRYQGACSSDDMSECQFVCDLKPKGLLVQVNQCGSDKFCCNYLEDTRADCCETDAKRISIKPPPASASHSSGSSKKTPVAAIAGGVVGGVAGLALLSGLGWWFMRRRRRARQDGTSSRADEEHKGPPENGLQSSRSIAEADAGPDSVLVESDAQPVKLKVLHELQA